MEDRNKHARNARIGLRPVVYFGEVQYFFEFEYLNERRLLAYVRWLKTRECTNGLYIYEGSYLHYKVVRVDAIDTMVGLIKAADRKNHYIVWPGMVINSLQQSH
jgi:hypothetical protein